MPSYSQRKIWFAAACVVALLAGSGCLVGPQLVGFKPRPPRAWPADLARRYIALDGVVVSATDTGSGPVDLVLLSGLGGSSNDWVTVVDPLAAYGRVIVVDWPGFGSSQRPPPFPPDDGPRSEDPLAEDIARGWYGQDRISVEYYASLIPRILDAFACREVVLVGHSLGGHVVAYHATEDIDPRVLGVVLISPSGMGQSFPDNRLDLIADWRDTLIRGGTHFVRWGLAVDEALPYFRFIRRAISGQEGTIVHNRDHPRIKRYLKLIGWGLGNTFVSIDAAHFIAAAADAAVSIRQTPMADRLHRMPVPALVIGGANDRVVPATHQVAYAAGMVGSRYIQIRECGHVPQIECPDVVTNALLTFVRRQIYAAPATQPVTLMMQLPCDPPATTQPVDGQADE